MRPFRCAERNAFKRTLAAEFFETSGGSYSRPCADPPFLRFYLKPLETVIRDNTGDVCLIPHLQPEAHERNFCEGAICGTSKSGCRMRCRSASLASSMREWAPGKLRSATGFASQLYHRRSQPYKLYRLVSPTCWVSEYFVRAECNVLSATYLSIG